MSKGNRLTKYVECDEGEMGALECIAETRCRSGGFSEEMFGVRLGGIGTSLTKMGTEMRRVGKGLSRQKQ